MTSVESSRDLRRSGARRAVMSVAVVLCGTAMLIFGVWALVWPASFATMVAFPPYNIHLLHEVGAFQIGIGVGLLIALVQRDALTVTLVGFVVAGTLHTINHGIDLHLGGHSSDRWGLGALVLIAIIGLIAHVWRPSSRTEPREPQP